MADDIRSFMKIALAIEIIIFNKETGDEILSSFVYDISDSDTIIISNPISNGRLRPVTRGIDYYFRFYQKNTGMFLFKGTVVKYLKFDDLPSLQVKLNSKIKKLQRREFFRVEKYMTGCVYIEEKIDEEVLRKKRAKIGRNNDIIIDEVEILEFPFVGYDISGSGIRFSLKDLEMEIGNEVSGTVLLKDEKVKFHGIVIRKLKNKNDVFEYGISFKDLENDSQSKIVSFVFTYERDTLKKRIDANEKN